MPSYTNPFAPPPAAAPPPTGGSGSGVYTGTAGGVYVHNANPADTAKPGGTYGGNSAGVENDLRGSWLTGRYGGSMGGMNGELARTDQGLARGMFLTAQGQREQATMSGIGAGQAATGNMYGDVAQGYGTNAAADNTLGNTDRASQQGALDRLRSFYQNGPGPSAAQAQLQQGGMLAQNQNTALTRSARGGVDPTATRSLAFQNAGQGQQTAQQAKVLGAQEAADWRNQQGQAMGLEQQGLGSMRAQDLNTMGGNLQGGLQTGQLGQGYSGLGSGAINSGQQIGLGYTGTAENAVQDADRLRQGLLSGQSTADVSQYNTGLGINTQMNSLNAQNTAATVGALGAGGAQLAGTVFGQRPQNQSNPNQYDPNAEYSNFSAPAGRP